MIYKNKDSTVRFTRIHIGSFRGIFLCCDGIFASFYFRWIRGYIVHSALHGKYLTKNLSKAK